MKPLFIAVSLLANAAFLAVFAFRPALVPPTLRDFFPASSASPDVVAPTARPSNDAAKSVRASLDLSSLFTTEDLRILAARLRAAGFPNDAIRAVVEARLGERYDARLLELTQGSPDTPFWKAAPFQSFDPKRLAEYQQLVAERSRLTREILGALPPDDSAEVTPGQRRQYGGLSPSKIAQLERIQQDYSELDDLVRASMAGITLPGDREALALLEREKRADLAAVLTPQELADYDLRNSPVTARLRSTLGAFHATEAEFRTIYDIEQTFDGRINPTNLGSMTPAGPTNLPDQRTAAQSEMAAQLKNALGDQRYADFVRAGDRDYQQLVRLTERENLPAQSASQVWSLHDQVSQELNRISKDAALGSDERAAALQSLAQNTHVQLVAALGPTAGEAYARTANWLASIERLATAIRAKAVQDARSSAPTR